MQMRKLRKSLVILSIGILVCLAVWGLKAGLDYWESLALNRLANQLGIDPSWEDLRDYVDRTFVIGMTQDEVLAEAGKIGPYQVQRMADTSVHEEMITFDFMAIGFHPFVGRDFPLLIIEYDENAQVTRVYQYELD